MNQPLHVVYVPDREGSNPWKQDVIEVVGKRHHLMVYDYESALPPQFDGADVVIDLGGSWGTREMADAAAESVKLWQILGNGFDHFDLAYWRSKEIPVANCPGHCSGSPLAESAMMFMLMLGRSWYAAQKNLRKGTLYRPFGAELEGRRLGLIGFGASGRELARRAGAFGMKISAIDIREISPEEQGEFALEFAGKPKDMDRVISESDYVSLHLHLNDETRHIINKARLQLMKPTACLINVARGALIDEQALYHAIAEGRLAGAGLDVYEKEPVDPNNPLFKLPNVVSTPHIAGTTDGTSRRRAATAAENCDRIAAGLEPLYRVDGQPSLGEKRRSVLAASFSK
jgi:phosphoglycerate dehydrogenase-like enzyme